MAITTWTLLAVLLVACSATSRPTIMLEVASRQPDSITIRWNISEANSTVDSIKVNVNDLTDDYHITYEGDTLVDSANREATLNVHESNKTYNVCLVATLTNQDLSTESIMECVETSTIVPMQLSSIIALICVIGFFVLCVVVGYCSWKCASKGKEDDADYEKSDVNGNGDIVPLTQMED